MKTCNFYIYPYSINIIWVRIGLGSGTDSDMGPNLIKLLKVEELDMQDMTQERAISC